MLGAGATVGVLLPWSRAQESEADHVGLIDMTKAGYHPSASKELWVHMEAAAHGREKPPEFLSTHPREATRITQIGAWLPEALRYYQPRGKPSSEDHSLHNSCHKAADGARSPMSGGGPRKGPHPSFGQKSRRKSPEKSSLLP